MQMNVGDLHDEQYVAHICSVISSACKNEPFNKHLEIISIKRNNEIQIFKMDVNKAKTNSKRVEIPCVFPRFLCLVYCLL